DAAGGRCAEIRTQRPAPGASAVTVAGQAISGLLLVASMRGLLCEGVTMSLHRATLVVLATVFTAGLASAASAGCCDSGYSAPAVYASSGCGGCGTSYAPVTYVQPAPVAYASSGCGGCGAPAQVVYVAPAPVTYVAPQPAPVATWGTGCGCNS